MFTKHLAIAALCTVLFISFPVPRAAAQSAQPARATIAWHGNVFAAYKKALAESKPLVIYFYVAGGQYSTEFERTALADPRLGEFASKAVFARVDSEQEDNFNNIQQLIAELDIKDYPTVVVIEARPDALVEQARLSGMQSPATLYRFLLDRTARS